MRSLSVHPVPSPSIKPSPSPCPAGWSLEALKASHLGPWMVLGLGAEVGPQGAGQGPFLPVIPPSPRAQPRLTMEFVTIYF